MAKSHKKLEGEGSYQGTRDYNQHARERIEEGIEEAAQRAKRAVEKDPQGMKEAERKAQQARQKG